MNKAQRIVLIRERKRRADRRRKAVREAVQRFRERQRVIDAQRSEALIYEVTPA